MKIKSSICLYQIFFPVLLLLLLPGLTSAMELGPEQIVRVSFTTADGAQHEIEVIGFSHEVLSPRDAASGLPSGKRQHKPFVITKPVGKSTPLLWNALTAATIFPQWSMDVWAIDNAGKTRLIRTVELFQPNVCGANNTLSADTLHEQEQISFCYQTIIWTFHDGGTSFEDDWETPVS